MAALILAPRAAMPAAPAAGFRQQARSLIAQFGGKVDFAAVDLKTGQRLEIRGSHLAPTASVIKLPVMVEAFYLMQAGKLSWSQPIPVSAWDRVPGSGIVQFLSVQKLRLGDAITLMIDLSDNSAANAVIDAIRRASAPPPPASPPPGAFPLAGIQAVNARMRQLGLKHTRLLAYVFHSPHQLSADRQRFGLGVSTPDDMVRLLTLIDRHRILTPAACERMLTILSHQMDIDAFPRYTSLPGVTWMHKTGALNALRNDVGIVRTPAGDVAMAGFAYASPDQRWTADNAALIVLAHLAQVTLEKFGMLPVVKTAASGNGR